jgi:membrane fusion protein, copper/silver efflux system
MALVELDDRQIQLAGIQTSIAKRESIEHRIRTVGEVMPDETKIHHVHTKFAGWIEKLFVNFTGRQVKQNEPLLSIYSPELYSSQEEYIRARRTASKFMNSTIPEVRKGGEELIASARRRLELFDLPESAIRELEKTEKTKREVMLNAPVSGYVTAKQIFEGQQIEPGMELFTITDLAQVWVEAEVYEYEARDLLLNQKGVITLPYESDYKLEAVISYIYPTLNPDSRTLKIRLAASNQDMKLKPSMFANVELETKSQVGVVVPDTAVMDTGLRKIVFLETSKGRYEPQEVTTGVRSDGKVQITSGVDEGAAVVTKSNFLVDSESRLRSAISEAK